jgi:hypothetical protein
MAVSAADQAAMFLFRTVVSQIVGAAASEFITTPLLSTLNISDNSQERFQEEVLAELDAIRHQLHDMQVSLAEINTAVHQLQQSINAHAISASLRNYYAVANRINRRYDFFVNGVAALANPDGNHAKAAADLFIRLAPPNDATVSDAMDEIHSFVMPNPGVQGLFDIIVTGMLDRMTAFAQDESKYTIVNSNENFRLPSDDGLFSTRRMLTGSFAAAREYLVDFAVPLMKHILATESKGLLLLSRAWAGGLHDGLIPVYVGHILEHISRMRAFFAEQAVPAAKQFAPGLLEQYGRRLRGTTLRQGRWSQLPLHQTGPSRRLEPIRPFLDDDWVMWEPFPDMFFDGIQGRPFPPSEDRLAERSHRFPMVMLHKPWEDGVRRAYMLYWTHDHQGSSSSTKLMNQTWQFLPPVGHYFTIFSPAEFLKQTDVTQFLSSHIGEIALGSDEQLGIKVDTFSDTPPAALSELVEALPTTREELVA